MRPAAEGVPVHARHALAGGVDHRSAPHIGSHPADLVQQAHALDDRERDIANASGVSLAAIGYHFGSKEVLLNEAVRGAIEDWGEEVAAALAAAADPGAGTAERFEATWTRVIESFAATRPLWALQFEVLAHIERTPDLRRAFAGTNRQARLGLADLFGVDVKSFEPRQAEVIGAYYQALLVGLAAQWLADPEDVPTAHELLHAVKTTTTNLLPGL
ncbi:TetR/AcrR family transcriptional regulator [Actinomadura soli]|uniref:TetR/AcrR family transcriptional regulator n=1 Tax=Actinomadura soli TaxID=2508997 RepID=A0A5C4J4A0_9ACTN|nr:TetR/AcrR family transcriptional regulator [Actinomadura soli]TMQ91554.1 TetR/AcrR family transcriptional regulator [Actinomadura soli]